MQHQEKEAACGMRHVALTRAPKHLATSRQARFAGVKGLEPQQDMTMQDLDLG